MAPLLLQYPPVEFPHLLVLVLVLAPFEMVQCHSECAVCQGPVERQVLLQHQMGKVLWTCQVPLAVPLLML